MAEVSAILPRVLSLIDMDRTSATYGAGDRYFWAWKLIDFGNGTFQGMAHGLARLVASGLLPSGISEDSIINRIDALFQGANYLRRSDGSMEEAFPYEGSFCVTALVAYDLLSAIELLAERLTDDSRASYLNIIRPMIDFLQKSDETHAFISNHLATASAALIKWDLLSGEDVGGSGENILQRILNRQSSEGWFLEYEGADPGYQSLCTYYLADIHRMRPDLKLLEPLRRSVKFLWYFAHPDGSFGGLYGSRNTRFYYPAGLEALAEEIPEAASLSLFMRKSISDQSVVTLGSIDEPNLIPMFNAYCWAALEFEKSNLGVKRIDLIPAVSQEVWRKEFPDSGLLIDKGINHYTIVSIYKGGVCYQFVDGERKDVDAGVAIRINGTAVLCSTQGYSKENSYKINDREIVIESIFSEMPKQLPSPLKFIVLRMLNVTVMRSFWLREKVKQFLVKMLITGKKSVDLKNERRIVLGPDLKIQDVQQGSVKFNMINIKTFSAIHMASQGYWQKQDDAFK